MAQITKNKKIHKEKSAVKQEVKEEPTKHKKEAKEEPTKHKKEVKEEPTKRKKAANLEQLPTIQNMLEIAPENRDEKANKYFEQVKPFLLQYMQKKQGSRVVQLIFKWGGPKARTFIHKTATTNWKDLIKSKFALYVLEKIGREMELPGAVEDTILLQASWKGARILQESSSRSEENSKGIKDKFYALWEKGRQNDIKAQESLHNLVLKIIEKQYDGLPLSKLVIRLALPSMFPDEKQKVLDYMIAKVTDWVNDDEGVRLFIELVNLCDPKQKKTLIKSFKGNIGEIVELNNQTYIAVTKLLTEVDDTVQIEKSLLPELEELIPTMATKRHAFSILFALFSPRTNNFNVLGKYEHQVQFTECKKSEEQRKKELRAHLYGPLMTYLEGDNLHQLLKHHTNHKIIVALYKSMQEDNQTKLFNTLISRVAKLFLDDAKDNLKAGTFENSLCAHSDANKVIKGIFWLADDGVDFFCDEFAKLIVKKMEHFLKTKAGFVLLGLIEKGGRDYLLVELRKHKALLKDAPVGKHFLALLGSQ